MADHVLLCGLGQVGFRILEEFLRLGERVTVVTRPDTRFRQVALERGAEVVEGDIREPESLLSAGLKDAKCLVLASNSDEANLEAALIARETRPDLPIVLRVFDQNLAERLERAFNIRRAFSTSALAAPAFAAAALGDSVLHALLLEDTILLITQLDCDGRGSLTGMPLRSISESGLPFIGVVRPDGALDTAPPLSGKIDRGTKIVAAAFPAVYKAHRHLLESASDANGAAATNRARMAPRELKLFWGALKEIYRNSHPALRVAVPCILSLLLISVIVFQHVFETSLVDAFYFTVTTMTTVGYGDYSLRHHAAWVKLFASLVMLASVALVAITFGVITDFIVSIRFQEIFGARRSFLHDHIVISGLGKVGYHIADYLDKAGEKVVVVERNADNDFAESMRGRVPTVIGDARLPHALRKAAIDRAKAIVAVTSDDLTNLSILLNAREANPGIRTVLRMFDPERAQKIKKAFGVDAVLSRADVVAPTFAAAALDHKTVSAFRLGPSLITFQRVRLVHKPAWVTQTVSQIRESEGVIPIARRPAHGAVELLAPGNSLRSDDEVILATPWKG